MAKSRPCISLELEQLTWLREQARTRDSNVSEVLRTLIERAREEERLEAERELERKRKLAERTRSWRSR